MTEEGKNSQMEKITRERLQGFADQYLFYFRNTDTMFAAINNKLKKILNNYMFGNFDKTGMVAFDKKLNGWSEEDLRGLLLIILEKLTNEERNTILNFH